MDYDDIRRFPPAVQKQILDKLQMEQKPRKLHNVPTEAGGIRFDSAKEARRYQELAALERAGEIRGLKLQAQFTLVEGYRDAKTGESVRPVRYIADFVYSRKSADGSAWETIVEDVKGYKTPEYKIKAKLMREKYGIEILET